MPRAARVVVPNQPHHITQRGNNRQPVFFDDQDREAWLARLFEYSGDYRLRILAYCLMTNHVHLVASPADARSLAKAMGRLQADYARFSNFRRRACGHLWQERFYSCPMEEPDALTAMAYVERNPLRAGLVTEAGEYRWSSAAAHLSGTDGQGRLDIGLWAQWYTPERWRKVLAWGITEEGWEERFREATRRGLPFGSDHYIRQLEQQFRKNLHMRPRGRPSRRLEAWVATVSGNAGLPPDD